MRYAIFTFEGNAFPIAQRLIEEGKEVFVGQVEDFEKTLTRSEKKAKLHEPQEEKILRLKRYNNILSKMSAKDLVRRLKKVKNPKDYFVFFDSNNLFYYAETLKNLGFHGNFPTEQDRIFEIDRNKAKEFVKKHYPRVKVAEKKSFVSIDDAKKFLAETTSIWVLKSQTDSVPTFVPETDNPHFAKNQILETLKEYKNDYEKSGFFLEVKIPSVIEVTPEKYYYNGVPLAMDINIENKFIGSGNLSMQVGCAGDLIIPASLKSPIHDIAFPPIVDKLAKRHKGLFFWDASLLINRQTGEIYFGEFCPNRPGYNSIFTLFDQVGSVSKFFENCVNLKSPFQISTVGASLMLFNISKGKHGEIAQNQAIDITSNVKNHVWGYDFWKKNAEDSIRTTGYDYHLAPITGSGHTLKEAVKALYKHVNGFSMTNLYYRPEFDFLSKKYASSIMNRLAYCLEKNFFTLPFPI